MNKLSGLVAASLLGLAGTANAVPYYYVDWTAENRAVGTASGTITLPDASTVSVGFSVTQPSGAPGSFAFAQIGAATDVNYWSPSTPYISSQVDNAPGTPDIIALRGGTGTTTYTVTLSEAIKDPIMAIVSLGQPGIFVTYDFDRPFTIVSQGAGYWGGTSSSLTQLPGDVLRGNEGHGTIQFLGTFSTFSWTAPTFENWHGFTFGIRTTERIEPTPVPEPATLVLLGIGLAGFGLARRYGAKPKA